jgi:aspartyl-tRNA synthetase
MIKRVHRALSLLQDIPELPKTLRFLEKGTGERVKVNGWVKSIRSSSPTSIFITLSDCSETLQLLVCKENLNVDFGRIHSITNDTVISVEGRLKPRPAQAVRAHEINGDVELEVLELKILNKAHPLPLVFKEGLLPDEEKRLEYRYLDLRRKEMQRNIRFRSSLVHSIRQEMHSLGFIDIETPLLFKGTPEGAAEFIVEKGDGLYYALPQSPQQFKQLLVIGGFDKYYQIAKCFRNEDLRSDRQPEFTQIDIEMGFSGEEEVIGVIERVLRMVWSTFFGIEPRFEKISYDQALCIYGSDKPDLRGEFYIQQESRDADVAHEQLLIPTQLVDGKIIQQFSSLNIEGTASRTHISRDDLIIFKASRLLKAHVGSTLLGRVRQMCIQALNLEPKLDTFLWVNNFPLFCENGGQLNSMHHPFTAPRPEQKSLLLTDPLLVRAHHYDLVLNGVEIGGGSVRIHDAALQEEIFRKYLKLPDEKVALFQHLLDALKYGAPPHAGFAIGLDRLAALMCNAQSIRDVIAFPKNSSGHDLLFKTPIKK